MTTDDSNRLITVTVSEADSEIVTDRMWQWGVQAVGETSIGHGVVEIFTSVGNDQAAIDRAVASLDPGWRYEVRAVDARVDQVPAEFLAPTWYAPNMVSVPAALHPVDLTAMRPSGDDTTVDPLVTVIDPGSAFGLGDHPTTQTSMAMLARLLDRSSPVPRDRLLDVGCGTGALAVLAAQLGVPTIRAIDIADAAVEATLRNAELNEVAPCIDVDTTPIGDLDGSYDLIAANILAPVLISIAPDLKRLLQPDGALVVSGILAARHAHVLHALKPLAVADAIEMDSWITLHLQHPSPPAPLTSSTLDQISELS
jgi:ribosomal protein L11 methyltransferase